MNKKSSQTSEMAVKISEKRSKLALERAFKPTEGRRTRDYVDQCTMVRLCHLFESQNVLKSCSLFLPDVGSAERLNLKQNLNFDSPFLLVQSCICSTASSCQHVSHDINSSYSGVT